MMNPTVDLDPGSREGVGGRGAGVDQVEGAVSRVNQSWNIGITVGSYQRSSGILTIVD